MASNNKIKTNKNCAKMKINFGIIFGILAVVIIATVIIIATSEHFYECVRYDWYEKIDTSEVKTVDNMNDTYDFYRIYLEDDNTFVLKYRLKEGTMLYTANGTYEKTDDKLVL